MNDIKVLVVDDSAVVRRLITQALESEPGIRVVAQAADAYAARDALMAAAPDVVTLDIEMPRLDGLSFLRKIMHYRPMPVIIVSSQVQDGGARALEALSAGAFDVVGKPASVAALSQLRVQLVTLVKSAFESQRPKAAPALPLATASIPAWPPGPCDLIAIGASTGGTVAIEKLLSATETNLPPIVIAQHMPATFTRAYAERVNQLSALSVREAVDGEPLMGGTALVAPGGKHLLVRYDGASLRARVKAGPLVSGHAPSVDVLFRSVAETVGPRASAALLTGMGRDGAEGLLALRRAGGRTVAQDEASCVVFGMPRAAIELDGADEVLSIDRLTARLRAASLARTAAGT
jgi:two-component system, chemotaxis family, protein-glutamate methylesterase/glutaminase